MNATQGVQAEQAEGQGERALLEILGMSKRFSSEAVALDDVSLVINEGEFFTIIGPSGSGKTTLLRIIGGFEQPDSAARFTLAGVPLADVPPHRRNVATVFQHYALFPHMSVGRNVEYGLKLRGVPAPERKRQALEALAVVRLPSFYDRTVGTLSGGERQRVALARVFVTRPALLLLDEPLGALDEKLRADMQFELQQLQQTLGMTFVYITHNQDEALTMSDRLAVLHGGKLQQLGTPKDVYERPQNRFVAEFMGAANLIPGKLARVDASGRASVIVDGGVAVGGLYTGGERVNEGQAVWLSTRPEHLVLDGDPSLPRLSGVVVRHSYRGAQTETAVRLDNDVEIIARGSPDSAKEVGRRVEVMIDPAMSIVIAT
ncbi:MAG TPA: ABC transporter ATP-binding protein [Fimbriimonadaceae bacterium]|nr:ABC transporter ATP-binding protein [Fimbriimonadaceae bacterium]